MPEPKKNSSSSYVTLALIGGAYLLMNYFGVLDGDGSVTVPMVGSVQEQMLQLILSGATGFLPNVLDKLGGIPGLEDIVAIPKRVKELHAKEFPPEPPAQ